MQNWSKRFSAADTLVTASPSQFAAPNAAEGYLHAIQSQWQATGVPVSTRVAIGAAPELIVHVANQINADLIVMSTHGRSGLSRFLYGSVAEAVLRGTQLPLLLIPAK